MKTYRNGQTIQARAADGSFRVDIDSAADYRTFGSTTDLALKMAAGRIAKAVRLSPGDSVVVTGAWNDGDGSGCVECVADALRQRARLKVSISEHAPSSC